MSDSIPYLGSKISLISKSEIRYEGILYTIDAQESIIALARVQSFGTEDRHTDKPIPARDDIYEYIIFRGADIKKIEVCESPKQQISNIHNDPAIVGLQHAAPSVATSYPGVSLNHQPLGPIGSHGTFYGSYGQQIGHQNIPTSGFSLGAPQPSEFSGGIGTTSVGSIGSASVEPHSPIRSSQPLVPTPIGPPPLSSHSHQQQDVLAGSRSSTPSATRKSPVMDAGVQVSPPPQQLQQQIEKKRPSNQSNTPRSPLQQNQNQNQSSNRTLRDFQGGQSRRGQGSGFYQQSQNYQYHQGARHNLGYQGYYQGQGQPQQQQQQYQGGQYRGGSGGGGMGGRGRAPRRNNQSRGRGGFNQGGRQRQDQQQQSFDEEFDFEQANVEFEELRTQLAKTKISDGETSGERKDDKRDDSGHETATTGDESEDSSSSVYYDKTKSFFDSISCEALERSKGRSQRSDWRAERKINVQTFGVATARRGYYPRGRGGYYNRGGYYRNYNQGYYRGNSNNYRGSRGGGQNSGNSNRSIVNGAAGLGGGGGTVGSMNASGSYASVAAK